jgi:hypothetical protein
MSAILLTSGAESEPGTLRLAAPRILTLRDAAGTRIFIEAEPCGGLDVTMLRTEFGPYALPEPSHVTSLIAAYCRRQS